MNYQAFIEHIQNSKVIAITAPESADGDSVGTQCALKEYINLEFPDIKVRIVNEGPCPKKYDFLKEAEAFELSKDIAVEDNPDTWICVDGGPKRVGKKTTVLWNDAKVRGQIDHHKFADNNDFDFTLNDSNAAATTEILFKLFMRQGFKMTPTIAEALYVGFIFDTGMFKHSNTKPETLIMASELLKTGFNHTDAAEKSMLIRSKSALRLRQHVAATMNYEMDDQYVWATISHAQHTELSGDPDDKDGLIDTLFLTPKCEIAILYFEAEPKIWKISFRSRRKNVAELARTIDPNGGGHSLASGCTFLGTLEEAVIACTKEVRKILE